jgi:hypothetical protein
MQFFGEGSHEVLLQGVFHAGFRARENSQTSNRAYYGSTGRHDIPLFDIGGGVHVTENFSLAEKY